MEFWPPRLRPGSTKANPSSAPSTSHVPLQPPGLGASVHWQRFVSWPSWDSVVVKRGPFRWTRPSLEVDDRCSKPLNIYLAFPVIYTYIVDIQPINICQDNHIWSTIEIPNGHLFKRRTCYHVLPTNLPTKINSKQQWPRCISRVIQTCMDDVFACGGW